MQYLENIGFYLVYSNIVDMDRWILHADGDDVIILRMERKIGRGGWWWHECSHYLQSKSFK